MSKLVVVIIIYWTSFPKPSGYDIHYQVGWDLLLSTTPACTLPEASSHSYMAPFWTFGARPGIFGFPFCTFIFHAPLVFGFMSFLFHTKSFPTTLLFSFLPLLNKSTYSQPVLKVHVSLILKTLTSLPLFWTCLKERPIFFIKNSVCVKNCWSSRTFKDLGGMRQCWEEQGWIGGWTWRDIIQHAACPQACFPV